jgi:hypothetical protein
MEINSKVRKYGSDIRRKIVLKISKLKEKTDFVNIFNIIQLELGKEVSINRNGIFFNINLLSDETIEKLENYFIENTENLTESETKIKYKPYSVDELESINNSGGPKLSNQEKSIIKKLTKLNDS